jgi:hypothetical protein
MNNFELGLVLGACIGYVVSTMVWRYRIFKAMHWFLEEGGAEYLKQKYSNLDDEEAETNSNVIKVMIEEHQGEFFLYRESDNMFVAQGRCMADFTKILPSLNVKGINIVNGTSEAAQALIKTRNENEASNLQ